MRRMDVAKMINIVVGIHVAIVDFIAVMQLVQNVVQINPPKNNISVIQVLSILLIQLYGCFLNSVRVT